MTQPEIIAHQKRLISELRAATAERTQAESRAATQRQEALRGAAARAEAAQQEAGAIAEATSHLARDARQRANLTKLPAAEPVSTEARGDALEALRASSAWASRTLDALGAAADNLRHFRGQRHAARVRAMVIAAVALLAVAIAAGYAWNEAQKTAVARAQAQRAAEALAREAPSWAFAGVSRDADWEWVWREFDGVPMALVPAGCFEMGSNDGSGDERPPHQVCFEEPFWIDVYEVTNEQFARLGGVAAQDSRWTEAQRPREQITWAEAQAFCQRRGARLPTEAEWEYAARGPDALVYPWGNEFVKDNVVYSENSRQRTRDVGSKPGGASWVGALDMSGNVWEWVNDWYEEDYYSRSPQVNPQGPGTGERRVLRGGSWYYDTGDLRAAYRSWGNPEYWFDDLGFRCALSY